jgi:hypothetical protein
MFVCPPGSAIWTEYAKAVASLFRQAFRDASLVCGGMFKGKIMLTRTPRP